MVSTQSSPLLWLAEAALPVSAGASSKQEKRWREGGSEPQVEAPSKRQEADPVRRKSRAIALKQSRYRSRPWLRPAVSTLLRMRSRAPDRSRATRRALRLQVQRGVPVPKRQATPSVRTENNVSESSAKTKSNRGAAWSAVSAGGSCRIRPRADRIDDGYPLLPCRSLGR